MRRQDRTHIEGQGLLHTQARDVVPQGAVLSTGAAPGFHDALVEPQDGIDRISRLNDERSFNV